MFNNKVRKVYACYNVESDVRRDSSSGGVFYLLAKIVLNDNGVVFGAKYDDDWQVIHAYIEDESDIIKFMGSKYVQSKIGDCYKQVGDFLRKGRKVLFSGTPCQNAGLYKYLSVGCKIDNILFENLYMIDFICHGVPSRRIWREYIQEKFCGDDIQQISFRDKTEGWSKFSLRVSLKNKEYRETFLDDLYLRGFMQNIFLRPSCYSCKFKMNNKSANITLADFWSAEQYFSNMKDDKGVSIVIANDKKGMELFDKVCKKTIYEIIDMNIVIKTNPACVKSNGMPFRRKLFYSSNNNILVKLDKYSKIPFLKQVWHNTKCFLAKVKRIVRKLS